MEKAFAYICAPEDAEARLLARYCRKVFELGYVPICPKQVTNDYLSLQNPEECKEYHATARQLLRRCRMVVVCGNETTSTMLAEIGMAEKLNLICTTLEGLAKIKETDAMYRS